MAANDEDSNDRLTRKLGESAKDNATDAHQEGVVSSDASLSFEGESEKSIGRYCLLQRLGRGGFGVVYRAEDQILKRFVALKLLTRFQTVGEVDAWLQEGRMLAGLDHPAIVPVFDVGKTDTGQPFIVSKLIEGGPLDRRIGSHDWTIADTVRVVTQLARALDYLHRRGVIHRDLKPGNILTTPDGNAVLADFGLALPESGFGRGARFVGTPAYMSPEQARHEGHRVDGRSDIYSLGVVMYELLTGKRPFQAADREQLLDCVRNVEVRPPRQLHSEIPRELERICMKALAKKISERYSTASDFAEDLEEWQRNQTNEVATAPMSQDFVVPSAHSGSSHTLELDNVAVVPHGLRPFDTSDADFFRFLLPGARDRFGVPESIRFWTKSILSRDTETAFRVGVLLGPSGSGKSSLMRAGVLPLVDNEVSVIYVEAKPDGLEETLSKQIRRVGDDRSTSSDLLEQVTTIRQSGGTRRGKKLLIVIDQFEQWLNHHRVDGPSSLRDALRQCDGATVQTVLIVRDDFVLGISAFMDELEESMQQNKNFATVESFGAGHAKHVLAAFGRAYGAVNDPPTPSQTAFIDEAIRGIEALGRIDPLQIALMSEMTKGKPWSTSTLKELGGISGLGVAFLEEKLAGPSAHPLLRTHPNVVRRVLGELLPADNTIIKPPAMLESQLLERLDGTANEELLHKILQLLDTEVRLITPTSSMRTTSGSTQSGSSTSDPAYQLTHDYLVPATRAWLSLFQSETRAGRVREQLREISAAWNAKPSKKRLPTLAEWGAIRWFTSPKHWTVSERRMIQACDRRILQNTVLSLAIFGLLACGSTVLYQWVRGKNLAHRLKEVKPDKLVGLLKEIDHYRGSTLAFPLRSADGISGDEGDQEKNRVLQHKLHFALANCKVSREDAAYVCEHLHEIEVKDLSEVLNYLRQHADWDSTALIEATRTAFETKAENALPLAAFLAMHDPNQERWKDFAPQLVTMLLQQSTTQLGYWTELFVPIQGHLVPPLLEAGGRLKKERSKAVDAARALLAKFAKKDPASLARAVPWVGIDGIEPLLKDAASRDEVAVETRALLMRWNGPNDALTAPLASEQLTRKLTEWGGALSPHGGWAERIPLADLPASIDTFQSAGMVPKSIRPFIAESREYASVAWIHESAEVSTVLGVSQSELEEKFASLRSEGWTMVDFASLLTSGHDSGEERWYGVWHRQIGTKPEPQELILGGTKNADSVPTQEGESPDLIPLRFAVRIAANGDLIQDVLLTTVPSAVRDVFDERANDSAAWTRLAYASGDLYPGLHCTDLRSMWIPESCDRGDAWREFYELLGNTTLYSEPADRFANLASRLVKCGAAEEALEWLDQLTDEELAKLDPPRAVKVRSAAIRFRSRCLAILGRREDLKDLIDALEESSDMSDEEKHLIRLRYAVLIDDRESALIHLGKLEHDSSSNGAAPVRESLMRALAIIASIDGNSEISRDAKNRLRLVAIDWLSRNGSTRERLLDCDFDAMRSDPAWQQLLDQSGLASRVVYSGSMRVGMETRFLIERPSSEHRGQALRWLQQGFAPIAIDIRGDADGVDRITSVWSRAAVTPQEDADHATSLVSMSLALAYFGQYDAVLDCFRERWGRGARTCAIANANAILSSHTLVQWLQQETSTKMQAALLETLGGVRWNSLDTTSRNYLEARVPEIANSSQDASLANTARWCCRVWDLTTMPLATNQSFSGQRNWSVNSLGQLFVRLDIVDPVLVGKTGISRVWKRVDRTIAIAATEVTGDQFREFLDTPKVQRWIQRDRRTRDITADGDGMPQRKVSWEMAIRYCQWLNEKENIPKEEWCYTGVWSEKSNDLKPARDYLSRTGYRLPTQAEWNFACAAQCTAPWHFGHDESFASLYEWTTPHSDNRAQPVASLRPNAFGIFDLGGNLAEWVDDVARSPIRGTSKTFVVDGGNGLDEQDFSSANRVLCGGRFRFGALQAVSDSAVIDPFNYLSISTGFRIARTMR